MILPNDFKEAVTFALNDLKIPVRDIANALEINDSTVTRWASGIALPHPLMLEELAK